jgi:hypothetical protein
MAPFVAAAATEQHFDVLQIGTASYTNVTVTTKGKDYVFLLHKGGMGNIKVADLTPELRETLGYGPAKGTAKTNRAAVWAEKTIARLETPEVLEAKQKLQAQFLPGPGTSASDFKKAALQLIGELLAFVLLLHIVSSYCFMLICRKAGSPGGAMVWLPGLQVFPLLRAAGMSGWWVLGFMVPILNLIGSIMWAFKIVKARGKSAIWALFLLLPVTNILSVLYLALSSGGEADGQPAAKPAKRIELMTLETA